MTAWETGAGAHLVIEALLGGALVRSQAAVCGGDLVLKAGRQLIELHGKGGQVVPVHREATIVSTDTSLMGPGDLSISPKPFGPCV